MMRPQINPPAFIALQNAMAASLCGLLLAAEMLRRMVDQRPDSEMLWRLASLSNRTLLPVLHFAEQFFPTPDRLLAALVAGILIPLLAWLTRYWFLTAAAGHVTLAALVVMTAAMLRRGNLELPLKDIPEAILAGRLGAGTLVMMALCLLLLVMCIADHIAFVSFMRTLCGRRARRAHA